MPDVAVEVHAQSVSKPRRRRPHFPRQRRVDRRTKAGRRASELQVFYTETLRAAGRELSLDLAAAVMRASELSALAERMRGDMLRGVPGVSADDVVRVDRLAALAVARLGIRAAPSKDTTSLADILAGDHK